jgi:F-type H+-transporting ATPase subunit b
MDALANLGINIGYFLIQFFAFLILLLALTGWLYNPVLNVLEERKQRIAKGLEDARQASIARDNADEEAKKILDAARAEAAKIRQDAAGQGEETRKGIVSQAEEEAKRIVADAREDAEEERNRILSDLRSQVAAIAIAAANKLVREALDEERQRALVADFFAKIPAGVSELSGDTAEVTSALPLTEEEKEAVRNALQVDSIQFKVDPGILGGLIVRVGDQVVDNSVASRMSALQETLLESSSA